MLLLVDVAGDNEDAVADACSVVVRMANARGAEGFIAVSPEARRRFWLDRARTAAIAAHTNAFKINEDVVIPLDRLADYAEGIERINIEYSTRNKLTMIDAVLDYLGGGPAGTARRHGIRGQRGESRHRRRQGRGGAPPPAARSRNAGVRCWSISTSAAATHATLLPESLRATVRTGDSLLAMLLRRELRIS